MRSATPLSTEITAEAVAAFGREAHESAANVRAEEVVADDNLVEPFLPRSETPGYTTAVGLIEVESVTNEVITAEYPVVRADMLTEVFGEQSGEIVQEISVESFETPEFTSFETSATQSFESTKMESFEIADNVVEAEQQLIEENFASEPAIPEIASVVAQETEVVEPFELPVEFAGDATASFEIEAFATSDVEEESAQPVAEVEKEKEEETTSVAAEESYAEISSELQIERIANDALLEDTETVAEADVIADQPVVAADEVAVVAAVAAVQSDLGAPAFVTETMAELLVSQGFVGRAIEIYEELVHRNPDQSALFARLDELRAHEATINAATQSVRTPRYSTPIRNTPVYATPQYTPQYTPQFNTPLSTPPLTTAPVSTSATPAYAFAPASGAHEQIPAGRTARERFSELARRRVPRRTPTHATAVADDPSDGLSSLFGTTQLASADELAARALADAFGPVQDSGESLFDLSSPSTPHLPLRALTPRSFTPVKVPALASVENRSAQLPTADYSFDRFFPDPAVASRAPQSPSTAPASDTESVPPANEDLAQFSAWLKGLNNA